LISPLGLQSFDHGYALSKELASRLGIHAGLIDVHVFPDGESRVTVQPPARTTILYCPLDHPNAKLVELGLAAEALRGEGAERLVLVAPYLCYMRQDRAFHPGEAVAQRSISRWLACHFDRIITVDPHLHRTSSLSTVFPETEADNLSAAASIAAFVVHKKFSSDALIVGPDSESRQWVEQIATQLNCAFLIGEKKRLGDRDVRLEFPGCRLSGQSTIIVDDIISSGQTIIEAIKGLKAAGAGDIFVAVTHALFSDTSLEAIYAAGVREVWSTDSIPHSTNRISLAPLLAAALQTEKQ